MAMLWAFYVWMCTYVIGKHIYKEDGRWKLRDVGEDE